MNETIRLKEEMAAMRSAIAGLRMQMHWLMSARLQGLPGIPAQGQPSVQVQREMRENEEERRPPPPPPPQQRSEEVQRRRMSGEYMCGILGMGMLMRCRERKVIAFSCSASVIIICSGFMVSRALPGSMASIKRHPTINTCTSRSGPQVN